MESQAHIDLVNIAFEYIKNLIPDENRDLLQRDSAGDNSTIRIMGKYIPDIYYNFNNLLIIGEAKTLNDFERLHSREQFESYLTMCEMHLGKSVVVVSVPWQIVSTAKNYFKRLIREKNYTTEVIIINELGRCFKI